MSMTKNALIESEQKQEIGVFDEYENLVDRYRSFTCDGSCNNNSDVCAHLFEWRCTFCGSPTSAVGEDMQISIENGGECLECQTLQKDPDHYEEGVRESEWHVYDGDFF